MQRSSLHKVAATREPGAVMPRVVIEVYAKCTETKDTQWRALCSACGNRRG